MHRIPKPEPGGASIQPPDSSDFRVVLTTCATPAEAKKIARTLVETRLAACVQLLPAVTSIYRWQDRVETSTETLLLIKTSAHHLRRVEESMASLHSYAVPEFVVLEISSGSNSYLQWLAACMK